MSHGRPTKRPKFKPYEGKKVDPRRKQDKIKHKNNLKGES